MDFQSRHPMQAILASQELETPLKPSPYVPNSSLAKEQLEGCDVNNMHIQVNFKCV